MSVTSCRDCDVLETGSLTEYGGGELKDTLFDILTVLAGRSGKHAKFFLT